MTTRMIKIISFSILSVALLSCTTNEKDTRNYIELEYPNYFPSPNLIKRNPLTEEGVALGKKLFFDTSLSSNNKVSCATCHKPELAFSDGQALSSFGVSEKKLMRNSPALINLAWMNGLFWDGGVHNLESLPFAALTNSDEMDSDLFKVSENLNKTVAYKKLFKKAFNIDSISSAYIARALAQYQRTLIFSSSKYDKYVAGKTTLSPDEQKGFEIFKTKCAICHTPPLFTDNDYHNNGLDSVFPSGNLNILKGRYRITQDSADLGKYKTPTLRNLTYTSPYMHDGRFATLEAVLDHYQTGLLNSASLDSAFINFSLSDLEKKLILDFLKILNDGSLVSGEVIE